MRSEARLIKLIGSSSTTILIEIDDSTRAAIRENSAFNIIGDRRINEIKAAVTAQVEAVAIGWHDCAGDTNVTGRIIDAPNLERGVARVAACGRA